MVVVAILLGSSLLAGAVQIQPALVDVEQASGSTATYLLSLFNDSEESQDVLLYLADWQRLESGEHDWDIPVNGARWILSQALDAGDAITIRYRVQLPESGQIEVQGTFSSSSTGQLGEIEGAATITHGSVASDSATHPGVGDVLRVVRRIESVNAHGVAMIALEISTAMSLPDLTLYEVYERRVQIDSVEAPHIQFDTVNRSNADWIELSDSRVNLQPSELKHVQLTVTTPSESSGEYWAAVIVEMPPREGEHAGSRVLTVMRAAIKLQVTIPGTAASAGEVSSVILVETEPLTLEAVFTNTGNTELDVFGTVSLVDQFGVVVWSVENEMFRVLPGGRRTVSIVYPPDLDPLPAGIYQAIVSFDYGGEGYVVGVRAFRAR